MRETSRNVLGAALLALLAGCDALNPFGVGGDDMNSGGAAIQVDSAAYHVRTTDELPMLVIRFTYTNSTGRAMNVPTCGGPFDPQMEKWEGGRWRTVYSPYHDLCLGPGMTLESGQGFRSTYHVYVGREPNVIPRLTADRIAGMYRLIWRDMTAPYTGSARDRKIVPLKHRVSETFELLDSTQ